MALSFLKFQSLGTIFQKIFVKLHFFDKIVLKWNIFPKFFQMVPFYKFFSDDTFFEQGIDIWQYLVTHTPHKTPCKSFQF